MRPCRKRRIPRGRRPQMVEWVLVSAIVFGGPEWVKRSPVPTRRAASARRRPWSIWRPPLALAGERVLVVDLDPQGNATSGFGIDRSAPRRQPLRRAPRRRDLRLERSSRRPSTAARSRRLRSPSPARRSSSPRPSSANDALARALAAIADRLRLHPRSTARRRSGLLTVNALTAADSVLIPTQCEYYALEGLSQLIATLNLVRDNLNPALAIKGVVLTMFDARTNLSADVARRGPEPPRHAPSSTP